MYPLLHFVKSFFSGFPDCLVACCTTLRTSHINHPHPTIPVLKKDTLHKATILKLTFNSAEIAAAAKSILVQDLAHPPTIISAIS
jgi:hypothetical protein